MNPLLSAVSRYFRRPHRNRGRIHMGHRKARRTLLYLEPLEERMVPASLSVADVTVREGPTSTGILDPAGAASVGISGIKGIIFDSGPSDPHYGDLFVTGYLSHSVARFDWASQTYQPFVLASNNGGLNSPDGITVGPDGNVYVSDPATNTVFRYDASGNPLPAPGQTGAVFVPAASGGLNGPSGLAFGPDGSLLVTSDNTKQILKYQGPTDSSPGAYIGVLVSTGDVTPDFLTIGPDGYLYVGCDGGGGTLNYGQVNRYDPLTGAPIGTGVFVTNGSGGLTNAVKQIVFDPSGANMYVVEKLTNESTSPQPEPMGQVLRFQGPAGQNPGAYVEAYITSGQGNLSLPIGLARDNAGNLYVSDRDTANVTRFAPSSQSSFVVTLDAASSSQVSVNYATADVTALAGTDYTQTSGTLVFPAGVTSETVNVPITTTYTGGPTKTFTLSLSGASGASISRGTAIGSILNRQTKFFVVDYNTLATYEYGSGGTSEEIIPWIPKDNTPRGAATTAAGTTVWAKDAYKNVYVYTNHGVFLGTWTVGGLSASTQLTGITTNGTDIWMVDAKMHKVYKYTGAAGRTSGTQSADSSFSLSSSDSNPQDIVTDGASFWVVDGTALKVFKYTLSGSLLGSWSIDPANAHPTGITLNPNNVSDIWIVDNGTNKVYQYIGAASRTSGSQSAGATFALNPYDTNPQGIADPQPILDAATQDLLQTPTGMSGPSNSQGMTALGSTSVSNGRSPSSALDQLFTDLAALLSDAWNAYQSEVSSVAAMWHTADSLALQRLDGLLNLEAGAMGMTRGAMIRDLLFASMF